MKSQVYALYSVTTVKECVENLRQEDDKEKLVESLWGAERCLRVLESVRIVFLKFFKLVQK